MKQVEKITESSIYFSRGKIGIHNKFIVESNDNTCMIDIFYSLVLLKTML